MARGGHVSATTMATMLAVAMLAVAVQSAGAASVVLNTAT